jgi:hypothetical protein
VDGLINWRGEVPIHHGLCLHTLSDTEPLAQDLNVGKVFCCPACHELARQDVAEFAWDIQVQLLIRFEQAHRRQLVSAQLKQKGRTVIIQEELLLPLESVALSDPFNDPAVLVGDRGEEQIRRSGYGR